MTAENFVKEYSKGLASQNWDNLQSLIHQNACVTFSNGVVHAGREQVKAAFEKNFATIKNEAYEMSNLRWLLKGENTAVYLFDFFWQGIINGESAQGKGIGTTVIVNQGAGWQLLTEHLGKSPS